jgi:hypothetical protein
MTGVRFQADIFFSYPQAADQLYNPPSEADYSPPSSAEIHPTCLHGVVLDVIRHGGKLT